MAQGTVGTLLGRLKNRPVSLAIKGKQPQGLQGAFPGQGHGPSVGETFRTCSPGPQSASLTREETFSLIRWFKKETKCLVTTYYVPHADCLTSGSPLFSAILQRTDDAYQFSRSGGRDPETVSMSLEVTQLRYDKTRI